MKILMVLTEEFPPDDRVEKEAVSLIEHGHQVTIACQSFTKNPKNEKYKGIDIKRKYLPKFTFKLSAVSLILPFYFNFWHRFLNTILKKNKYDAIHVHDLPLAKVGYKLSKKYNLKFICDQHEFYSNWIVHTAHMNTPIGKIAKTLSNWKKYEKTYLNKADLVITIEEPLRENYIKNTDVNPDNIILVPNTPSTKIFNEVNVNQKIVDKYKNNFVLFYAGGIDILRGIHLIIDALPKLQESIPNIKFVFGGKIRKGCDPIGQAKRLGVYDKIEFVGWIDVEELPSYISASDICMHVPPVVKEESNLTIATKIFQYIAMEKPIIVGQAKLMKQLIVENELGMAINDGDANDLAEKVLWMYSNKEAMKKFSYHCKQIKSKFIWEDTIKQLINYYDQ